MNTTEIMRLYEKGMTRTMIVKIVRDETILTDEDAEKLVNEVILHGKRRPK